MSSLPSRMRYCVRTLLQSRPVAIQSSSRSIINRSRLSVLIGSRVSEHAASFEEWNFLHFCYTCKFYKFVTLVSRSRVTNEYHLSSKRGFSMN